MWSNVCNAITENNCFKNYAYNLRRFMYIQAFPVLNEVHVGMNDIVKFW